jgi:hypothetical protein
LQASPLQQNTCLDAGNSFPKNIPVLLPLLLLLLLLVLLPGRLSMYTLRTQLLGVMGT